MNILYENLFLEILFRFIMNAISIQNSVKRLYDEALCFDDTVNGERYYSMLNNHLMPELRRIRKVRSTIFMQDGAPTHISTDVKDFLKGQFGDRRVISRHFPQFWPPRSPDLNPCDYWLWGHVQGLVYSQQKPASKQELINRITIAISSISQEICRSAVENLIKRLEAIIEVNGEYFQHLI